MELAREARHDAALVVALRNLGNACSGLGAVDEMVRAWEESAAVARASYNVALSYVLQGRHDHAVLLLVDSLTVAVELRWPEGIVFPLEGFASVAVGLGQLERAARFLGAADALGQPLGLHEEPLETALRREALSKARVGLGDRTFEALFAEGGRLSTDAAVDYALHQETND